MLPIDPVLLQTAVEPLSQPAYDIALGPYRFSYPWGDSLSDEFLVLAVLYLCRYVIDSRERVDIQRARWGWDDDPEG